VSFAAPLVLLGLAAIPPAIWWYVGQQRRRERAAAAFAAPRLAASVAPLRPGWRRHAPMLAFAVALIVLIAAAARPQRTVAVPVTDGAIMLANDVSSSMQSTDVAPSRLGAAQRAAERFVQRVPGPLGVGLLEFNQRPVVLQSPTTDHSLLITALRELHAGGHTDVGDALLAALHSLRSLPAKGGKHPPSAIVLISDGYSTGGSDPLAAARQAAADHIPIYTVAVGTDHGTLPFRRGGRIVNVPVPIAPQQLAQIASLSGGRAFTAADSGGLTQVYEHLAAQFGHKRVKQEISASFAGGGLALLLLGSALSLRWFGRLA
jgi:Ca-activated chloride channel family protein